MTLAAVIATAGVIADSTATVIGAMIVAPLMTPILGTALAVGLAERRHVVRSVGLVAGGAVAVIAVSLVPPLAVVGLLLSVERYGDATGAALLFGTNVAAIIATGTIVLLFYKVRQAAKEHGYAIGQLRGRTLVIVISLVVIVAWPRTSGLSVRSMRGTASSP